MTDPTPPSTPTPTPTPTHTPKRAWSSLTGPVHRLQLQSPSGTSLSPWHLRWKTEEQVSHATSLLGLGLGVGLGLGSVRELQARRAQLEAQA